jgi:hypothetical protein
MKARVSIHQSGCSNTRASRVAAIVPAVMVASFIACAASVQAQNPFSYWIPTATPTATVTMYTGSATIVPGRVAADRAGNTFYVAHVSGTSSTLYEIPASSPVVAITSATPLLSGLGAANSNSAFVDASGSLWVSNGNGAGGPLIEIPAENGIPNTGAITGSSSYTSSGLPIGNVSAACSASSTSVCVWSAGSIGSNLTSLQVADVYSDGAGNVYLVDIADNVSSGSYNRIAQFSTASPGILTVLADKLTSNPYAQIAVAGDGNVYYCDSVAGNSSGGLTSLVSNGALSTVGNTPTASLTLLNPNVKVQGATGITSDPWGDLIISGPKQLSEIPLENGALNFLDQFNILLAVSGANSPVATNNIVYGGTFDVHGSYEFATATNIIQIQIGGYNFGQVAVGKEVTTAAPYLDITWSLPSELQTSLVVTASPSTLTTANAAYLQSFPYGGAKNFFGGTPYGAANPGQYALMYFQPVHPGLLTGAFSPQGYSNAMAATDSNASSDFYNNGAYVANLQGVGIGPRPMFLPGVASQAVNLSQLYTSYSKTAKAVALTPVGVALDSFGDIFVADNANTSLDLYCLASTANTAQNYRSGAAGNGYANSYCLTNGLGATTANLTGSTFKVSATGTKGGTFPTNFITPVDLAIDGANNVYVLDSGNDTPTVTKMPFSTMIPSVVIPASAQVGGLTIAAAQGITIDGYGNLYISDTGNNRIIQARLYNAQYSQNIVFVPPTAEFGGTAINGPTGLGINAAGDLFIVDSGNRRVVEYSVTGVGSVVTINGVTLENPTAVKVLPSGALVIADNTLGLVLVDNGVGSVLSTGSIKLSSTGGIGLDFAGNIYVADPNGSQVVELNTSAPGTALFPDTLKPDASGSHTGSETSYVYDGGNATLNFSEDPTVADNTSSATNEFTVDPNNECLATTSLTPGANCGLTLDFTPSSTAAVYTPVTGAATLADNLQSYTLIANPASATQAIGNFGTTGSTQTVNLSANATVPFTAQTINFSAVAPITWSTSVPPVQLTATGGATGNPVVFSIASGLGTLSGPNNSILTLTQIGTTVVAANQVGGLVNGVYYSAAPQVTQAVVVNPIGVLATPTFSIPAGTYTAVQSVTISDSTQGATIYYTTNGNPPTTSSPVYTGASIPVNATTTIKAIAVGAPGYAKSAVASATYVLNPDFTLKPYVTSFDVPNGLGASTTLSLTPLFAFSGKVTLGCTGLYSGDSCSFLDGSGNPTTRLTTTGGAVVYGTLVIQANEQQTALNSQGARSLAPVGTLAVAIFVGLFRKRKRFIMMIVLVLGAISASVMAGCTDPSTTGKIHSSTFTLTATSGSIVHTTTITLNVNNLK